MAVLTVIIQQIIKILTFIAGLLVILPTPPAPKSVAMVEYDCAAVEWTVPPAIQNGAFTGTSSVRCLFEGAGGGSISNLKAYLISQLPPSAGGAVETSVETYEGMPSLAFPTSLQLGNSAVARGTTHIASDDKTVRSIFASDSVEATGNAHYLKAVAAEMTVVSTDGLGTYEMELSHAITVKKPLLISNGDFLSALKTESEKSLADQAVSTLQEMASHL